MGVVKRVVRVYTDMLLSLLVLQDRLGGMPANKMQFKSSLGWLKDSLTAAHYNLESGSEIELTVRKRGGRR